MTVEGLDKTRTVSFLCWMSLSVRLQGLDVIVVLYFTVLYFIIP
jgi:hypothetical protein